MADAWHNRSDALSSIGTFAAILGARMGFPILDPLASVVICMFILKAATDIFRDAVGKMTDSAMDEKTEANIRTLIEAVPGVQHLDLIRTRVFGDRAYVDIEIQVARSLPLHEAHDIGREVHLAVEKAFPAVKHCMVHVNPTPPPGE
jgi:cation diffusion facilitator family transporter